MNISNVIELGAVPFAPFNNERVYMREFRKSSGLPFDLAQWEPTVDAMLREVDSDGPIYLMVDQAFVKGAKTHRRPGVHIDGYWNPAIQAHGGREPSRHGYTPPERPRHVFAEQHSELLILASDVVGCVGYQGEFEGQHGQGGDCDHIDVRRLKEVKFAPGVAYAGDTMSMLHESIPVEFDCLRTVVRLNVANARV